MEPITRENYRAYPALNFSTAKFGLESALHLRAALDGEIEGPKDKECLIVGTAVHASLLEGETDLMAKFAIKPAGMSFATTAGKEWKKLQEAKGLQILSEASDLKIPRIAQSVLNNGFATRVLDACTLREEPILFEYKGVLCKALLDASSLEEIADLKTCRDPGWDEFFEVIIDRDYDLQAAWYRQALSIGKGVALPNYCWIAASNQAPFSAHVHVACEAILEAGQAKMDRVIELYKECQELGIWPAKARDIQCPQPPEWWLRQQGRRAA